jgi:hypothetical protein
MIGFFLSAGALTVTAAAAFYLTVRFVDWRFRGGILIILSSLYMTFFFVIANLMQHAWT